METQRLKISDLRLNKGQIAGLPANPRTWTKADIEKIARSLEETPELLEMRPIIVTPHEGKYIILGGSLRFEGLKHNKAKDAPCEVFEGTPDKMREIVIKDNGSFGAWDYDALGNEWDDNPLTEWGVPAWETEPAINPDDLTDEFSLDLEQKDFTTITFTLAYEQADQMKAALEEVKNLEEYKAALTYGNTNSNGNAISLIIEQWIASRK